MPRAAQPIEDVTGVEPAALVELVAVVVADPVALLVVVVVVTEVEVDVDIIDDWGTAGVKIYQILTRFLVCYGGDS